MSQRPETVDVFPVRSERLSARQFLKLQQQNPSMIARARVVLNELGSDKLAEFDVTYSRPIYKALKFKPVHR